jgi:hypothetical protein
MKGRVVTSEDHILQELLSMYFVGPHADNCGGGREANHAGGSVSSWALVAGASQDRGEDASLERIGPPDEAGQRNFFLSSPRNSYLEVGPAFFPN